MTNRNTSRGRGRARPGFSLLEITLVLVIIGVLMGVAAVNLLGQAERGRIRATEATMTTYKTNISSFMAENNGTPPANLGELVTAQYVQPDADGGPPKDAWDRALYYSPQQTGQGNPYSLISLGKDGEPGTEDDIDLWAIGATGG